MKEYERITLKEFNAFGGDQVYSRLQELENKLENGTLIELPCKVDDTVYMPWEYDGINGIAKLTVNDIFIDNGSIQTNLTSDNAEYMRRYRYGLFHFEDIGKTVFLTKAEAENKLKKLKGEV